MTAGTPGPSCRWKSPSKATRRPEALEAGSTAKFLGEGGFQLSTKLRLEKPGASVRFGNMVDGCDGVLNSRPTIEGIDKYERV